MHNRFAYRQPPVIPLPERLRNGTTYGGNAAMVADETIEGLMPRHPVLGHFLNPPERNVKVRSVRFPNVLPID